MKRALNTAINRSKSEKNDKRFAYDAKSRLAFVEFVTEQKASLQHSRYSAIPQLHNSTIAQFSNVYDHLDRRVQKITPEATQSFFYDGWMLVKEVIASTNGTTTIVEYHWGNDLSGTRDGAAGIGGLLYLTISNSSTPNSSTRQLYIPWYDSNGNVMGYWDDRGKVAASFSYGAFGETYATGNIPDRFPIRFSTKYHDIKSDLYYYTKRFYGPSLRRWLTRDTIGDFSDELPLDEPSPNLYCFLSNDAIGDVDYLGLTSSKKQRPRWKGYGKSYEFHNWNCTEWEPDYGTTAKYLGHLRDITFHTEIKVPGAMVDVFAKSVLAALEMENDATSYWCVTLTPLIVQARKDDKKPKYRIKMYVYNFDKHPECKNEGKREEIHQGKFEKKWVYYELQ